MGSQSPSSAIPGTPASENNDTSSRSSFPLTADTLAANATRANAHHPSEPQDAAEQRDHADTTLSTGETSSGDSGDIDDGDVDVEQYQSGFYNDGHGDHRMPSGEDTDSLSSVPLPSITPSPPETPGERRADEDIITDTVGAIAIDNDGNIACGASSGGIGMKFRGRVGPAALVGVGAAVCPASPEDKSAMATGCVTSGTGEHMATTLAANVCAERLYNSVRARRGGGLEPCNDDEAVKSMIEQDFMGMRNTQGKVCWETDRLQAIPAYETATLQVRSVCLQSRSCRTVSISTSLTTQTPLCVSPAPTVRWRCMLTLCRLLHPCTQTRISHLVP